MRLCTYMSSKTECLSLSLFVENSRCAYRRHEICKTRARRQAGRTDCRSSGGAVTSRRWEVAAYFFFFLFVFFFFYFLYKYRWYSRHFFPWTVHYIWFYLFKKKKNHIYVSERTRGDAKDKANSSEKGKKMYVCVISLYVYWGHEFIYATSSTNAILLRASVLYVWRREREKEKRGWPTFLFRSLFPSFSVLPLPFYSWRTFFKFLKFFFTDY